MLEASGFDFRNRHPQKVLIKLAKVQRVPRDSVGKTAYQICLDLYRTFAPLKQSSAAMAIACLELSTRIHQPHQDALHGGEKSIDYKLWSTSRAEVMGMLNLAPLTSSKMTDSLISQRHYSIFSISIPIIELPPWWVDASHLTSLSPSASLSTKKPPHAPILDIRNGRRSHQRPTARQHVTKRRRDQP